MSAGNGGNMPKNVQISIELFLQLIRYHYLQDDSPELPGDITKGLESKLEAMIRHDLYSVYKNQQISPAEREKARQDYLDRIGLRDSFRWPAGWMPEPPSDNSS